MKQPVIEVVGLKKSYKNLNVLKGISFSVNRGTILALLGPNGAGKTTTIRILSTLLLPNGGKAFVNGYDVVKQADEVKNSIGLTGQYAAVDEYLTGMENLLLIGRLYRLNSNDVRKRSEYLLKQFDLEEASKRTVKTYSGGMRRRLDLAMSLLSSPPVIFLDEPTTGLDPRSRLVMWDIIKKLAEQGKTILLTTQYMDEADRLADSIVVIDNGKLIAHGSPNSLKTKVGSDRVEVSFDSVREFEKANEVLKVDSKKIDAERRTISVATKAGVTDLKKVLDRLDSAKVKVDSVSLHRPTLDDVFLTLTGHEASSENLAEKNKKKGRKNG